MSRTDTAPRITYLKDYKAPDYKVESLHLDFQIFENHTDVISTCRYARTQGKPCPLVLNGEHMELVSIELDGVKLIPSAYITTEDTLTLSQPPQNFELKITTRFNPAENTALEGLYRSGRTFCTQCEAQGFRRITYFQDRPDVLSVFTVRMEADKTSCPVLLSNGNLLESGAAANGRHYALWHDPFPKPCYLFALVAGNLTFIQDRFTTRSGRTVDLRIYVREGDQHQCDHAMLSLKKSMKWDEDTYGREYQLDRFNIVAVSDFNMGAMENTSLNIFNTALVLAHPETATDADFYRVEGVIAHEYFHNWTGNRVTCRDWFQLSLKEGLTVFRDQEFSSDMNSRAVQRIDDVETLRSMQFPEDGGPLAHPVRPESYIEINNFYTMTVYEKGAEVVRMQATLLGKEKYRRATDLYFERHDGQAVTCDDFVGCMEEAGELDLGQFKLWYSQAGTPEVTATSAYDAEDKTFTLTLTQYLPETSEQPQKKPMHIPVATGLVDARGDDMIGTQILHLKDKSERFIFENIPEQPVPSILRNFSAPVRLSTDLSEDDLRFLMVHDTDGFNRWESAQTLALRMIGRMLDAAESGHHPVTEKGYLTSVQALLEQALHASGDKALIARMITLPDLSIIGQERPVVYPEHIHAVLTLIRKDICAHSQTALESLFESLSSSQPYEPSPRQMGERSLKAAIMDILSAGGDARLPQRAHALYSSASNMTDRMIALEALRDTATDERTMALDDFYTRFRSYPLVIDKWFGVQARAIRPSTTEDILQLSQHPDFNIKNPNRARSLYGAFAVRNPVIFHGTDGAGYALFCEAIMQLDPVNPQIASRLLTALRDWRRFDENRQVMMRNALEKILALPALSPNTFEIASKTLGNS
ncbi:MAG: aminopeptidase N [Pseudobdellovibrionaceae bacterium]